MTEQAHSCDIDCLWMKAGLSLCQTQINAKSCWFPWGRGGDSTVPQLRVGTLPGSIVLLINRTSSLCVSFSPVAQGQYLSILSPQTCTDGLKASKCCIKSSGCTRVPLSHLVHRFKETSRLTFSSLLCVQRILSKCYCIVNVDPKFFIVSFYSLRDVL